MTYDRFTFYSQKITKIKWYFKPRFIMKKLSKCRILVLYSKNKLIRRSNVDVIRHFSRTVARVFCSTQEEERTLPHHSWNHGLFALLHHNQEKTHYIMYMPTGFIYLVPLQLMLHNFKLKTQQLSFSYYCCLRQLLLRCQRANCLLEKILK